MKKFFAGCVVALLAVSAFAQGKTAANLVEVDHTNFSWLLSGTNSSLYVAPTSRTYRTAQHIFDWLDDRLGNFDPDAHLMPGTNIVGGSYSNDQWWGLMPGTNIVGGTLISNEWTGLMPGTSIEGATYNSSNLTWEGLGIDSSGWETLHPTAETVQAVFDYLDGYSTNVNFMQVFADGDGTNEARRIYDGNPSPTNTGWIYASPYFNATSDVTDPHGWLDKSTKRWSPPREGVYRCSFMARGVGTSRVAAAMYRHTPVEDADWFNMGYGGAGARDHWSILAYMETNESFELGFRFDPPVPSAGNYLDWAYYEFEFIGVGVPTQVDDGSGEEE